MEHHHVCTQVSPALLTTCLMSEPTRLFGRFTTSKAGMFKLA